MNDLGGVFLASDITVFYLLISLVLCVTILYNTIHVIIRRIKIETIQNNTIKPHIHKVSHLTINILLYVVFSFLVYPQIKTCNTSCNILSSLLAGFVFVSFSVFIPHIISNIENKTFQSKCVKYYSSIWKIFSINKINTSITEDIAEALNIPSNQINEEKEIFENIEKLNYTDVSTIMTPRVSIAAIEFKTDFSALVSELIESGYSRIPIYTETLDTIKGIIYIKDILPHIHKPKTFKWQSLIRPPYYIPETKKIDDLLEEFQKSKIHMAIVIDEYGGTSGLVCLEDILEEILGEIKDEFDNDEELLYLKVNDTCYICNGLMPINNVIKLLNLDDSYFDEVKGEADTIAGLLLEIKGGFPALNEEIHIKDLICKVEEENERRIKKIKIIINQK